MKAIETRYKGYRFRSRLEARWAVFFDALEIPWEYEPEGFEISTGSRYLPDFKLLPQGEVPDIYVEIKPVFPIPAKDARRLWDFSSELTLSGRDVGFIILVGTPGTSEEAFLDASLDGRLMNAILTPNEFVATYYGVTATRINAAVYAARGARFEFGEGGARRSLMSVN